MFKRQKSGSVVCPNCGRLVGVNDERCLGCGKWNPGLWGFAPLLGKLMRTGGFGELVTLVCVGLYVACLLYDTENIRMGGFLSMLSPSIRALFTFGMSGAEPIVLFGRWWTVLSAGWLHSGILHIFFNMWWIRQLAPVVGEYYGQARLVIIYTVGSIVGFGLSSLAFFFVFLPDFLRGAQATVGASAPLFGLFGALYYYGRRTGNRLLAQQFVQFLVIWLVIGFVAGGSTGIRIDNWAHLGGFGGGVLAARFLDPLRDEKPGHVIVALLCLAATLASIVASIVLTPR